MLANSKILITGGTGSWGNELVKQLLSGDRPLPESITIFSRNEFNQVTMQRKFNNNRLKFIIGDIRDSEALNKACKGIDVIFHLAALKHVPICEEHPYEAIKTNIEGTKNIVEAALLNEVKKVIDVSSDKAVEPLNLYGMTKAVGEKIIILANNRSDKTRFVCVRGGNAIASSGSVIPLFINTIKENNCVNITSTKMTRYFFPLPDAIKLVIEASEAEYSGVTMVMKMPYCKIYNLAKLLIKHYGNDKTAINELGIRQGEKLHETLVSEHEAPYCYNYKEDFYLISNKPIDELEKVSFKFYDSNSGNFMTEKELTDLLIKTEQLKS